MGTLTSGTWILGGRSRCRQASLDVGENMQGEFADNLTGSSGTVAVARCPEEEAAELTMMMQTSEASGLCL